MEDIVVQELPPSQGGMYFSALAGRMSCWSNTQTVQLPHLDPHFQHVCSLTAPPTPPLSLVYPSLARLLMACLGPRGSPNATPSLSPPWWPQSSRGLLSSAGGSSSGFSSFFFTSRTFSNRLIRRLPRVASSSGSSSSPSSWIPGGGQRERVSFICVLIHLLSHSLLHSLVHSFLIQVCILRFFIYFSICSYVCSLIHSLKPFKHLSN